MKKLITLMATLFLTPAAFAGDAGFHSVTCHTESKRTVLTILEEYSGFDDSYEIYTLVVDGTPMIMDSRDSKVKIIAVGTKGTDVIVNGELTLSMQSNSITVHKDPREGTLAQEYTSLRTPWSTTLTCKTFWPEP